MKKLLVCLMIACMLLSGCALAEDYGIQMIDLSQTEAVPMSLDDIQLNMSYTLDGYAIFQPKEFKYVDCFAQFGDKEDYSIFRYEDPSYSHVFSHSESNRDYHSWRYTDASWIDSGETADFLWLLTDITNLQQTGINYPDETEVKVFYQDNYQFDGWICQIVYDHMEYRDGYGNRGVARYGFDKSEYPNEITMNKAKNEPIEMMYTGTYAIGCTLPNFVVTDKASPLRLEIKLGDNTLTYHIRK